MKKKIALGIVIFIISVLAILPNNYSYAATFSKGPIEMETDVSKVEVGDTFTISVLIPMSESNVRRSVKEAEVTLTYDSNIIDCIKTNKPVYNSPTTLIEEEGKIKYNLSLSSLYAVGNGSVLFEATFKVNEPGNITLEMVYNSTEGTTSQKFNNEERSINIKSSLALNSISLSKEKINLIEGKTEKISVIYNPENTTESKDITWTSSNKEIASVDANGVITALSEGTAIITANCNGKEAECEVIVSKLEIPLESITIGDDISLKLGEGYKLNITYNPETTTDEKNVVWTTSDNNIVSVDSNGILKANSVGTAIITATVNEKQSSIMVTVYTDSVNQDENNTNEDISDNNSNKEQENVINSDEEINKIENNKKEENILDEVPKTGVKNYFTLFVTLLIMSVIGLIICRKNMYK